MPITVGLVIGMTLAPVIKWVGRHGVSSWITGPVLVLLLLGVIAAGITLVAAPMSEWIARAPEIGATVRQKLYVLDQPLAALRALQDALLPADGDAVKVSPINSNVVMPLVALLTPAIGQIVIFVGVLTFYLIGQSELRNHFVRIFSRREAKLRFLRIVNEIEYNLTSYLTTVTVINVTLGIVVALGAWLFGLPNPVIFGVVATVLNYVPYIGPAAMLIILFAVGLVTFPTLGYSLLPPLAFLGLTTLEGQFITPTIMGRRLTLNPLIIFLALAFWTWLWGPLGAFLAVPLSIIGLTTMAHLVPDTGRLPE
jgi:predicted PurR-regulated permease PerM